MCMTYACCSATNSICQTVLGNESETATGRKRSVLLLSIAIALALWFQYDIGPAIVSKDGWIWSLIKWVPGLYSAWHDDCASAYGTPETVATCAGNQGVYRPTMMATLFFSVFAVLSKVHPHLNKQAWPAKMTIFLFSVLVSMFIGGAPLHLYLWLARLGATVFLLLQQIILIDVAYNWNEDWVERAEQADRVDYGSGRSWLRAIVATCAVLYLGTLTGVVLLFKHFGGCSENNWIISLSLLGIIALTGIQLSGQEGSLLTSSVVSLYVLYLSYSMVSKNPSSSCNPYLGSNDVWSICIGLTLTAISLAWTGWSWTAEERLNVEGVQSAKTMNTSPAAADGQAGSLDVPFLNPEDQRNQGLVVEENGDNGLVANSHVWKLNVVMVLISCFVAMTLTGWGSIASDLDDSANAANPTVGRVNMAMLGVSQWLAIGLYVWTMVAPRLYPDYEFS